MATLKQRLCKKNSSGTYDTIHLETSASNVLMSNGTTVEAAVNSKAASNHSHTAAQVGALATTGTAASATKLATARTIRTNLAATTAASFNGTANITPGVQGVLPVANGGTGVSNLDNLKKSLNMKHTLIAVYGAYILAAAGSDFSWMISDEKATAVKLSIELQGVSSGGILRCIMQQSWYTFEGYSDGTDIVHTGRFYGIDTYTTGYIYGGSVQVATNTNKLVITPKDKYYWVSGSRKTFTGDISILMEWYT